MLDFLTRHWGDVATVAGLVVSVFTLLFARRASKAAEEARDSVLRQTLRPDMEECGRLARDVETFVALGQSDCASLRARDLMHQIAFLDARWEMKLPQQSKNNLLMAHEQLEQIHKEVSKLPVPEMKPHARMLLTRACHKVSTIFSRVHGAATAEAEREV
jgi:hypothetical protein